MNGKVGLKCDRGRRIREAGKVEKMGHKNDFVFLETVSHYCNTLLEGVVEGRKIAGT